MATNDQNELAKYFGVSLPIAASLVAFGGLFAAAVLSAGHILNLPVPCGSSDGCVAIASDPLRRSWRLWQSTNCSTPETAAALRMLRSK